MERPIHKSDVQIGGRYRARITDEIVTVRIDHELFGRGGQFRGWQATNEKTGRQVHIKTAAKLRGVAR